MDVEPVTFEGFFEDQKERLLRILSVITGSRGTQPPVSGISSRRSLKARAAP
jgi:hypothetical protein